MDNYKEHMEKSWSEKKDQFGGRQKGKGKFLFSINYHQRNHQDSKSTSYPNPSIRFISID